MGRSTKSIFQILDIEEGTLARLGVFFCDRRFKAATAAIHMFFFVKSGNNWITRVDECILKLD